MLFQRTLSILFFVLLTIFPLYAEQTLILSTSANPPLHLPDHTGTLDLLMKEAFGRIGVIVSLQQYPPEEALVKANQGETDGDAVRIGDLGSLYPNLLQVPAIAFKTNFVAFTKNSKIELTGWRDLKSYDIAIIKGHKISEKMVIQTRSLTKVKNLETLFDLLKNNKVDIVICEQTFGFEMVKKMTITDVIVTDPPLSRLFFYVYLHRKHEILIPGLIKALNDMQLDGTYTKIMNNPM